MDRERRLLLVSRNKTGAQGQEREEEWVRVPAATIEMLPKREAGQWFWPSRGVQARGHVTVNGALGALRRALKARGLPWTRKLDQYSFRRWWADSADAENISKRDAMRQLGHKKIETHMGYTRNTRRRLSQEDVEKIRLRRLRAAPQAAPQERAEQAHGGETSAAAAEIYAASSLCSR